MAPNSKSVFDAALALSPEERAQLAEELLKSLDDDEQARIDVAWAEEAERRYQAYKRGEIKAVPIEEIRRKLQSGGRA